ESPGNAFTPQPLPRSKAPADLLAETLQEEDPTVRAEALKALEAINPQGARAIPALEQAFRNGPAPVGEAAARALANIDPDAPDRVPGLADVLERTARVGGKYDVLLRRIKVVKDGDKYTSFSDYGPAPAYPEYE